MAVATLIAVPGKHCVQNLKSSGVSPAAIFETILDRLRVNKGILKVCLGVDVGVVVLLQWWQQVRDNSPSQGHQTVPMIRQVA